MKTFNYKDIGNLLFNVHPILETKLVRYYTINVAISFKSRDRPN